MDRDTTMSPDAAFWNDLAEKYAKKPVDDPEAFERKIAITKARIQKTDVILDVGCGTGSLALRLAPSAAHVHGLDFSSEMTRIARGKATAQQITNVTFHTGAFDEGFTTLAPASLDGVCAYSLLHLVADRRATLARLFALLKPGGFLVSSTVCLGESWIPYAPVLALMRWLGNAPSVKIFDKRALADDVRAVGFVDLEEPAVGAAPTIAFLVAIKPR